MPIHHATRLRSRQPGTQRAVPLPVRPLSLKSLVLQYEVRMTKAIPHSPTLTTGRSWDKPRSGGFRTSSDESEGTNAWCFTKPQLTDRVSHSGSNRKTPAAVLRFESRRLKTAVPPHRATSSHRQKAVLGETRLTRSRDCQALNTCTTTHIDKLTARLP